MTAYKISEFSIIHIIRDLSLCLGLLLTFSTQLRIVGVPIGPGEIFLACAIVLISISILTQQKFIIQKPLIYLILFWTLFFLGLLIGLMNAIAIGDRHDSSLFRHDLIAYCLVAVISILYLSDRSLFLNINKLCWNLVILGSVSLTLQLFNAFGFYSIGQIEPWYWHRLRGWSENANTLSLLCLILIFICMHLYQTSNSVKSKILSLLTIPLPLISGILTDSDSFIVAGITGAAVILIFKSQQIWFRKSLRLSLSFCLLLLAPLILIVCFSSMYILYQKTNEYSPVTEKSDNYLVFENRDAVDRFALWDRAVNRIFESRFLGLGPGPHIGPPYVKNDYNGPDIDLEVPTVNFEAHSVVLDLTLQGGLLLIFSLLWIGYKGVRFTIGANMYALTALLFGLAAYSITHLITRIPLVWIVLALTLSAYFHPRDNTYGNLARKL